MDLIARDSGGTNLVVREQAAPRYQSAATAPAASVELHVHHSDRPASTSTLVGVFAPGQQRIPVTFNPVTDKDLVFRTISISPSGTRSVSNLEDAPARGLNFQRSSSAVLGVDPHVPAVTKAASIAQAGEAQVYVFLPAPDDYASTLTDGEIRLVKADDPNVSIVWQVPVTPSWLLPQPGFPTNISYRWRNQSAEDADGGRGWSAWSPATPLVEAGSSTPALPPTDVLSTFEYDPNDSRAARTKGVIAQ